MEDNCPAESSGPQQALQGRWVNLGGVIPLRYGLFLQHNFLLLSHTAQDGPDTEYNDVDIVAGLIG